VNRSLTSILSLGLIAFTIFTTFLPRINQAQDQPQPAVVISIAEMDRQTAVANYLISAAGFPDLKFFAQTMIRQYTKGIDGKKPAGVLMYFSEQVEVPEFLAFMPMTNLEDFLDLVSTMADVDEEDGMSVISTPDGMELMVKEIGNYAFMASNQEMFAMAPADPAAFLGDQPQQYNLSAKIFGNRIPAALRNLVLDQIRESYEEQLLLMDEDSLQAELQEYNWQQLERYLTEMESILVGINADPEAKKILFDFQVVAENGSDLAQRFERIRKAEIQSMTSGFLLPDAAMTFHSCSQLEPEDIQQYKSMLESFPATMREELQEDDYTDQEVELFVGAAEDAIRAIVETAEKGILDVGAVLVAGEQEMNFAAGVQVVNPRQLEDVVKRLVPTLEDKLAGQIQVQLNSGSYKDVTFHQFAVEIPDFDDEALAVFGEELNLVIGVGQKMVYLGLGSDPELLIRQVMDNAVSQDQQLSFQMNMYFSNLIKMGLNFQDDPMTRKMYNRLADSGNDRIRISSENIPSGFRARLEIQDGILSLIKVAVDSFTGGFDDFDDDDF
jgi:hypothetical protein